MKTTFDRYLIARYLQIFVILFISIFGLFVVIDGFSNIDEFQDDAHGTWEVLTRMTSYYAYQSSMFLDLCGPIMTVVDAMVVFALLLRNSELHPILASGVPTSRLMLPVILGTCAVNFALVINQELIIPRIAYVLQTPRDALLKGAITIEPLTDHTSGIYIGGQELSLHPQLIRNAEFVLLPPDMARLTTTLKAPEAIFYPEKPNHPAGWLLKNVDKAYQQLPLTEQGRKRIRPMENAKNQKEIFIASEISFDQLYNRLQGSKFLSTPDLVRRLKNPSFGQNSSPELAQHLHARLVRPLANVLAVLVSIPLILRKESRGLVTNMAISTAVLSLLLGVSEGVAFFGKTGAISPVLAAWIPIFGTGTLFAWLTPLMLT